MSNVPRKRYRRESLEENKKLSDESDEEELYIPLKERRKLQFSALEQNQGMSLLWLMVFMTHPNFRSSRKETRRGRKGRRIWRRKTERKIKILIRRTCPNSTWETTKRNPSWSNSKTTWGRTKDSRCCQRRKSSTKDCFHKYNPHVGTILTASPVSGDSGQAIIRTGWSPTVGLAT